MIDHVESELTQLPEPVPPAMLATTVMERVSRLASRRPPAALASPASTRRSREVFSTWRELPAWAAALAGFTIVFVSWTSGQLQASSSLALISSQIGVPSPGSMPPTGSALFGLALGLLLYLAGLFAPLRNRQ